MRPSSGVQVTATAFAALFAVVGLALYGLPLYYDFMVRDFGWSRAQVTSGNAISKLLVANRGEIALRIMRTAREMDIATVAVFSDPDAGAPFVTAADEAVRLPGSAPADTYLRGDLIIEAAQLAGAGAVHPGYGFLSENAGFARACAAAGLVFVGPAADVIEVLGSKIAAKELLAAAGVPVLAGVTVDPVGEPDLAKLAAAADEIGYPVLVKAAFGGGGRGMRIVADPGGLADAVASARREAASAFGDGTSRSRSSGTVRAPSRTCSSGSARSSGGTRRSSRSRRPRRSVSGCAPSWVLPPSRPRAPSATWARARSSSCWTAAARSTSWRSTPGCRSSTPSRNW